MAAGRDHYCALRQNGTVYCWGMNYNGEIGSADNPNQCGLEPSNPKPVQVQF